MLVVTHLAWNPLVRSVELESRMAAVVELRGLPTENGVALVASLLAAGGMELAAMHVGVAAGAIFGCAMKCDVARALLFDRLMAGQAIYGSVTPKQFECGLVVIEASALFPGGQGMAAFTPRGGGQLSVRTLVAICAVGRCGVIGDAPARDFGVAARARHRCMRAFQCEVGLVMSSQRVDRGLPGRCVMAVLAPVVVARGRELSLVRIPMANRTRGERHAVLGVLAFRFMALRAGYLGVFSEQRVSGFDVV